MAIQFPRAPFSRLTSRQAPANSPQAPRPVPPREVRTAQRDSDYAYRLAVEESPLVQNIRNHVITFITPVLEVDGHEKEVDTFSKRR